MYVSGYEDVDIDAWACRVAAWAAGNKPSDAECVISNPAAKRKARDVYVYFDNDAKVHAPFEAMALAKRLGLGQDPSVWNGKKDPATGG